MSEDYLDRKNIILDSLSAVNENSLTMLDHMIVSYEYLFRVLYAIDQSLARQVIATDLDSGSKTTAFLVVFDIKINELENRNINSVPFEETLEQIINEYKKKKI